MEGDLVMSEKERRRKTVLDQVVAGAMTLKEGAARLRLSYRQLRRSYQRYRAEGDRGLVHGSRGRRSNRSKPAGFRKAVLRRYEERYAPHGVGPTLASEKLGAQGYEVARETLRQWLLAAGLWEKRRKRVKHRQRRERKAHFGELVQLDGSHHKWFGEARAGACLMDMVDDATGYTLGWMAQEETTEAAMRLLWDWIEIHGVPRALYTDKKNVFVTDREPTLEEQLAGREPRTAFGQACEKLGIEIITAHSPQAKGRVERKHGVYQDRLVKELGLRGITTIAGANRLLRNGFTHSLNARFAHPPLDPQDFHQPPPSHLRLEDVFCVEELRTVQNDWTLRYANRHYQILEDNRPLPKPKEKVLVRLRLDNTLHVLYRDKPLAYRVLPPAEVRHRRARPKPRPAPEDEPRQSPKPSPAPAPTPWRQGCTLMFAETRKPYP